MCFFVRHLVNFLGGGFLSTLVLVGGTGSLGTEITRQQDLLREYGIKRIRVISRDEQKQSILEKGYSGKIELQCFLGDIRSQERMEFALKDSDYLVHMAALKMIERFELDVDEGIQTNIIGTRHVAKAALLHKLKSSIFVSTDKAFQPINAYGVSKLCASHLWRWFNTFQKKSKFGVCAYGNVWASRGSVIELWHRLAKEGKPLPITDSKMTRFFITKKDAARFVLHSLFNNNLTTMIPAMKSAEMYRVALLFNQHYKSSGGIEIIGLRDKREKLHEDLGDSNSFECERFNEKELMEMIEHG